MIKRIRIKNFQGITDNTLELGRLTVLVGAGDGGKSAHLRALRAAMLNDGSDTDIRYGEKRCEVEFLIDMGDGVEATVLWWKDIGKGGCYRMGEREFLKTGGAVPEEIAKLFGIGLMEVDATTTLTPQLSDQFDRPFLIGETGSKRARILGKATRLDVVVNAQMACKRHLDRQRRELTEQQERLAQVTEQREEIPDTAPLAARLNSIDEEVNVLASSQEVARQAQELAEEYEDVSSRATAADFQPARDQIATLQALYDRALAVGRPATPYTIARSTPVLDFGPAREALRRLEALLEKAPVIGLAAQLRVASDQVWELQDKRDEKRHHLQAKREDYLNQCREVGVCSGCGGLLDHKEC